MTYAETNIYLRDEEQDIYPVCLPGLTIVPRAGETVFLWFRDLLDDGHLPAGQRLTPEARETYRRLHGSLWRIGRVLHEYKRSTTSIYVSVTLYASQVTDSCGFETKAK